MQQFKRSFWQLLFFLTLTLSLITFAFIKRPKFQPSLVVNTARVWGYRAPKASDNLIAFKNDVVVKGVFGILNKLFSDKKNAVSLFIHQFLLNEINLAKQNFEKNFVFITKDNDKFPIDFSISNRTRNVGLWSTTGEQALMTPNFKLSSLQAAQKNESWLTELWNLVVYTAVFDSDFDGSNKGAFNLQKTRTNIYNLFVGWVVEEMRVQLKVDQGLQGPQGNKGEQGGQGLQGTQDNKGDQGFGTQGEQGLRGPTGQNGQIQKEVVIGLSIGLGVFFCFFLACVMVIYSTFKKPQKSTKI